MSRRRRNRDRYNDSRYDHEYGSGSADYDDYYDDYPDDYIGNHKKEKKNASRSRYDRDLYDDRYMDGRPYDSRYYDNPPYHDTYDVRGSGRYDDRYEDDYDSRMDDYDRDYAPRRRPKKKKRHPVRRFFRNLLLILFAVIIAVSLLLFLALRKVNHVDPVADKAADDNTAADGYSTMSDASVTNILLIGQDAREGETQTRSDSMIICSINMKTKQVVLTSLMRDMYVAIPGYGYDKLNAAYAYGGMELLDTTIQEDFGIDINGNVEVGLEAFLESMLAVGDLDIDLTQEEADYLNAHPDLGMSTDPEEGGTAETWNLTAGTNTMTSSQLLAYCRMRYIGNSDWDRTRRQRTVLTAAIAKFKKSGPLKQYSIISSAAPSITTDITDPNLLVDLFKGLYCSGDMVNYQIPVEGTYYADNMDGADVLVPDMEANSAYLKSYIYGEETS
ncbi:MAG: LCP family protein [Eubacterium sp.]|jgi:LCP family protein required for cell wall assembly|nr:LCP family protein [Eubacterium sp.]